MGPKLIAIAILLPAAAMGQLCEKRFFMQSATQVIRTGSSAVADMAQTTATLGPSLSGLEILHGSTEYKIITGFQGSCEADTEEVVYRVQQPGAHSLEREVSTDLYVKLYSNSEISLTGSGFDVWFALSNEPTIPPIANAIGRQGEGNPFYLWYGTAYWVDSTKEASTGLWSTPTQHYFPTLIAHYDSAYVDSALRAPWNQITFSESHGGRIRLQMLKVLYDTIPTVYRTLALSAEPSVDTVTAGDSVRLTATVTLDSAGELTGKPGLASGVQWELADSVDSTKARLSDTVGTAVDLIPVAGEQTYTVVATLVDTVAGDTLIQERSFFVESVPTRNARHDQVGLIGAPQKGFVFTVSGETVRIRARAADAPERLTVIDARGAVIAKVALIGGMYRWECRTADGGAVPRGLYVFRSGSAAIGKVMLY